MFILNGKREFSDELVRALIDVKENVTLCPECMSFSAVTPCRVCADSSRDASVICVVSDYKDQLALETAGSYNGTYHVLHGLLAPLKGIGPDEIKIKELIDRVRPGGQRGVGETGATEGSEQGTDGCETRVSIREVILATSFDAEGEATALYINKLLGEFDVKITRIASGIPVGSYIEYMDPNTLGRAMNGRNEL